MYGWGRQVFFFQNHPKNIENTKMSSVNGVFIYANWDSILHGNAHENQENDAINMDSRSVLSSIKLMEETDVSAQTYSFLEVTAVRYDEKLDKHGQRCDFRDIR